MKTAGRGSCLLALLAWVAGCGTTEVVVGEAPGVARVVAGVIGESHAIAFPDSAAPGRATGMPIGSPAGVVGREDGGFLFTDLLRRRVGAVTPDGQLTWPVGRGVCANPGPAGTAPRALCLALPVALAAAPDGTLLIADAAGHRVYRYDPAADQVAVVLGTGTQGLAADGAVASQAPTARPAAVAVGPDGGVYVAEAGNHRVRLIRLGPDSIDTFAGTGVAHPGPDLLEAGRTAIAGPAGLAVGGRAVFVSDSGGFVVRRVIR
jgi:hypothetical protein